MFAWAKIDPSLQGEVVDVICRTNETLLWDFVRESGLSIGELKKYVAYKTRSRLAKVATRNNLPEDKVLSGPHKVGTAKWCFEALCGRGRGDLVVRLCNGLGDLGKEALSRVMPETVSKAGIRINGPAVTYAR